MSDEKKYNPASDFENPSVGENFGGSFARLELKVDEVSGLMRYVKDTVIELDDLQNKGQKKDHTLQVFEDVKTGLFCTGPIGAIWDNTWLEAKIKHGDLFAVKRYADAVKKGSIQVMKVYGIKVYERAK